MAANPSLLRPVTATARTLLHNSTKCSHVFQTLRHHSSSVSADELAHFSGLASSWWDPMGPSRVLHLMNPTRHDFIASCLAESTPATKNKGLRYLDVGCGGGIFAESLARTLPTPHNTDVHPRTKAASITAVDPSPSLIKIARDHARRDPEVFAHLQNGAFRYENTTVETLGNSTISDTEHASPPNREFDVITLFEVIEHVDPVTSSPSSFLTHCLRLLRPGGWLIGSTIARTIPSFVVNKMVAEAPWPIGVVPWGTHEWSKFVNADELRGWAEEGLMRAADGRASRAGSEALEGMKWKVGGVVYVPGCGWKMVQGGEDWGNYFWAVQRGDH
ncbi:2-polyprenyl-3-methyl-5-hydroxy-6-metoxy-1, 4-benzoquinol methylase [Talaromyces proteolyticus]|uniref:Ubiquinone biosynthesis O-methyltransferase, mitochondrial n=1 Tax=Talaromyces proteolyticus TaxID=1131652 RepID=A0AAD4Q0W6_9EURO|nr:2-polyprenyl-3-methyl-5-hydroxy-6-metoxy-1, 4-benzoquinol methylase [Talaromyces proteolyticus]KAH8697726.1 2-polyprenyl-3-methyl-5-hydroxy-6-metoxy-1, 4-benzoquinol methylase [Talaromyces proteolyticus]